MSQGLPCLINNKNNMLSLNTHIPIEYIKKSEKLNRLRVRYVYSMDFGLVLKEDIGEDELFEYAPTIADIIDNGYELFLSVKKGGAYYKDVQKNIFYMCQQDNLIKEISEYIIKNIIK